MCDADSSHRSLHKEDYLFFLGSSSYSPGQSAQVEGGENVSIGRVDRNVTTEYVD